MRVFLPDRPALSIGIERGAELIPVESAAMTDQRLPLRGPGEIPCQLLRQGKGKVETADPRSRPAQERFEVRERMDALYRVDNKNIVG